MNSSNILIRRRVRIARDAELLKDLTAELKVEVERFDQAEDESMRALLGVLRSVQRVANDIIYELALIRGVME